MVKKENNRGHAGLGVLAITGASGLSSILGLVRFSLIAYFFGISRQGEIMFAALAFQNTSQKLMMAGQFGEVILPVYVQQRLKSDRSADQIGSAIMMITAGMAVLISLAIFFAAPYALRLFAPGFNPAERVVMASYVRVLVLIMVLDNITAMHQLILNAHNRFGTPESISLISMTASIIVMVVAVPHFGPGGWIAAIFSSSIVGVCMNVFAARRAGFKFTPRVSGAREHVVRILRRMVPYLGYVIAVQGVLYVTNGLISHLPTGSYAIYNYVNRLYWRGHTLLIRGLSVVSFTQLARAAGAEKTEDWNRRTNLALRIHCLVGSCFMAFFIFNAHSVVNLLLRGASFTPSVRNTAALMLAIAVIGYMPEGILMLLRKAAFAMGPTTVPVLVLLGGNTFAAGVLAVTIHPLGIVAAVMVQTVATSTAALAMYVYVRRYGFQLQSIVTPLRYIASVFFMGFVASAVVKLAAARVHILGTPVLRMIVYGTLFVASSVLLRRILNRSDRDLIGDTIWRIRTRVSGMLGFGRSAMALRGSECD